MPTAIVSTTYCGKSGRLSQHSQTEARILKQDVNEIAGDRFATFLFESFRASEFDSRSTLRFRATQTGQLESIRSELNVRSKLFIQIAFCLRPMQESCG
jgi:hypothetical protein